MEPDDELTDDEVDAIHEQASEAAQGSWGPAGASTTCPYPDGTRQSDIWNFAFRNAYARENS